MLGNLFFSFGLVIAAWIGFTCFRDLGDVSQMLALVGNMGHQLGQPIQRHNGS